MSKNKFYLIDKYFTILVILSMLTACQTTISPRPDLRAAVPSTSTPDVKLNNNTATPFLTQATDTPTLILDAYVIFNDNVSVRSGPSALSSPIGVANKGEKAQAIGQTPGGGWIKIVYPTAPDGAGWVYAGLVSLHSSDQLPIAPDAQSQNREPTVQADPQELAAIQRFNPNEKIGNYSLVKSTLDSNLPNLKVDVFYINSALYVLDPGTNRVVEYEANQTTASSESSKTYTSNQLKQMAIQLVDAQVPGINLDKYSFELGQKIDNYFYMWFIGQPDQPDSLRVMYVGYKSDGTLLGYINALP